MSKISLLELLENKYNITNPKVVKKYGTWGDSVRWRVQSDYGHFFLKEKPYYLQFEEFVQVLDYQKFLRKSGIQTAQLKETVEKQSFFVWNKRVFALHEWLFGRVLFPDDENDLKELGNLAGEIAKQTVNMEGERLITPKCSEINFPKITNNSFHKYINILFNYFDEKNRLDKLVSNRLDDLKFLLEDFQGIVDFSQLTCSWIHGDLHYYNVIREYKSNILIPIDLDDAHWNYSLIDIAWQCILVSAWYWPNMNNKPILKQEIEIEKIYTLFDGFMKKAPVNGKDLIAFKYFLSVILIYSIICMDELNEHFDSSNVNYNTIIIVQGMIEKINNFLII
ncbi:phosphotransferase [Heyndrickxia sp. FSL W8-0423]|uniref:phosphotransferase n=1 Tax=Heyndrickxia sp. FSL W8-0423 TaxID=2921601 RepID=UPI0030F5E883